MFYWWVDTHLSHKSYLEHELTHWGRVTHICVSKLAIIGSDNGLSPGQRQAIIWTNAGILVIEPLGTKFSEIIIEIHISSFKKMFLKISSGKWQPFCLGLNVLTNSGAEARIFQDNSTSQEICTLFTFLLAVALGQSNAYPSALKNMDKCINIIHKKWLYIHNKTKKNKTMWMFHGIYSLHKDINHTIW